MTSRCCLAISAFGWSGLPWQLSALMENAGVVELLLERVELLLGVEHVELAVRIARVVAGAELDGR